MKQEPVMLIELVKILVNALVTWVVVMGFWPMTEQQQVATLTLALAVVGVAGAIWQRSHVTPVSDPKDIDRTSLRRLDGTIPLGVKKALGQSLKSREG